MLSTDTVTVTREQVEEVMKGIFDYIWPTINDPEAVQELAQLATTRLFKAAHSTGQ